MQNTLAGHRVVEASVERLEARTLFSAVIMVSPGNQDMTQAIQNALNSAGGGGTVNLSPGTYAVSSQLTLPSGVSLEGAGKATLHWTGGAEAMLYSPWNCTGSTLDGITLDGAGYKLDPGSANMTVSNNTFENISFSDAYSGNGLYIPDELRDSIIAGNTFSNITGNVGIYIFNPVDVQIEHNSFNYVNEPIKGQWGNGGSGDSISYNTMTEVYRFGIECQGNPTNLTISNNTLGNWQSRDSHIALSIATGEGNGINIDNNVILGTGISNPNTAYTAIEAMGDNLTISGNFASGWGWAELVGYTNHWETTNNTWGINTAQWVIEAGGVNPSVDSNNASVALNASPPASSSNMQADDQPDVNSAPTTTTAPSTTSTISAPAAATTTTTSTTSTAATTTTTTATTTMTTPVATASSAPSAADPSSVVPTAPAAVSVAAPATRPVLIEFTSPVSPTFPASKVSKKHRHIATKPKAAVKTPKKAKKTTIV